MRRSSRMRILGWVLLPVLVVLAVSWFAAAALLLNRVDQRIDTELASELSELRVLAEEGIDPETGQPFGDVQRLMQLHLERNIPNVNETMFYLVDGR